MLRSVPDWSPGNGYLHPLRFKTKETPSPDRADGIASSSISEFLARRIRTSARDLDSPTDDPHK